jgi:hypothetical protein
MADERWEGDTRGRGVGDAGVNAHGLRRLLDEMSGSHWVAEDPDAHLLPLVRTACDEPGSPWQVTAVSSDVRYGIELAWSSVAPSMRALRADAYALIGAFAETNTHVVISPGERVLNIDVTTGEFDGDGPFRGHGHVVRLIVSGDAVVSVLRGFRAQRKR